MISDSGGSRIKALGSVCAALEVGILTCWTRPTRSRSSQIFRPATLELGAPSAPSNPQPNLVAQWGTIQLVGRQSTTPSGVSNPAELMRDLATHCRFMASSQPVSALVVGPATKETRGIVAGEQHGVRSSPGNHPIQDRLDLLFAGVTPN